MGCVFPMVIWSEFHMGQWRDDHRKDAPRSEKDSGPKVHLRCNSNAHQWTVSINKSDPASITIHVLIGPWDLSLFLESGKPCKKTYYDKNLIIDHVEKFHTIHGQVGKICKVLIKRKVNQETTKPVPKPPEPTAPPPPKKPKDVFRCTYCQYKDKSIDKLHVSWKQGPPSVQRYFRTI